jgi:hypothetical protein
MARRADCQNTLIPHVVRICGAAAAARHVAAEGRASSLDIRIILITRQHAPTHAASATRWLPSMRARILTSAWVVLLMMIMLHCCRAVSCTVIARYTAVSVRHQSCAKKMKLTKTFISTPIRLPYLTVLNHVCPTICPTQWSAPTRDRVVDTRRHIRAGAYRSESNGGVCTV